MRTELQEVIKLKEKQFKKAGIIIKSFVLFFLVTLFLLYRIVYEMDLTKTCIFDFLQEKTYDINRLIDSDPHVFAILIGQVMMDSCIIFLVVFWLTQMKNMRLPTAGALFFMFRYAFVSLEKLPFPDNMVWRASDILPALTVPYDRTRDFFYSGHTGSVVLVASEIFTIDAPFWAKAVIIFVLIYMMSMLVIVRVHYTIDIIGGLIFCRFFYLFVARYLVIFDWFFNWPYLAFHQIKKCWCPSEEQQSNELGQKIY